MTDAPTRREEIARIIAPAAFLPGSERDSLMRNEWKQRVFAKADAILATDGREIVKELVEAITRSIADYDIHIPRRGRLAAAHAKAKDWLEGR